MTIILQKLLITVKVKALEKVSFSNKRKKYLLMALNVVALEKASFSNTQNPKTVC